MGYIRVLLVDDDPLVRRVVHRMLTREGYEVESAGTADEALASLARDRFDVAVVDFNLTGCGGGHRLLRSMRAEDDRTPVIAFSGMPEHDPRVQLMVRDCQAFLTKPVAGRVLVGTIERVCSGGPSDSGGHRPLDRAAGATFP